MIKVGKEYVKRITEQARAEAMEMEALGYRFSRLHDRMLNYLSEERLKLLEENVNLDYPFMHSEFSTTELYLYYTLHTDTLFCFFQPVWHKFSDALRETLVIDKFVKNPSYENMKGAVIAMDLIHSMSHTTLNSFLSDTYFGYNVVKGGIYTVSPPYDFGEIEGDMTHFPSEKLRFDPGNAAMGGLGIISDESIDYWLDNCSPNLIGLVLKNCNEDKITVSPDKKWSGDPSCLEFSYWFVNLNKICQREVDKSLV